MLSLLLAALFATAPPAFISAARTKPTDDAGVVQASFMARQKCEGLDGTPHEYSVDGTFPQLAGEGKAESSINRTIRDEVARLVAYDVPDCPPPATVTRRKSTDGDIECDCSVTIHNASLFSVRCESTSAGEDFGAHPQGHITNFIFDRKDGRRLDLDAILVEGAKPKFRELVEKNLDIAGMVDPAKFTPEEIDGEIDEMLKQCYIDAESITCEAPYWPLSYFTGAVSIDELNGIVRPDVLAAAQRK